MKDIVIIGAGGFGREVAWLIEDINTSDNEWNLLGYIDEDSAKFGKELNGKKILGNFEWIKQHKTDNLYYVCAVGSPETKEYFSQMADAIGIKAAILIHPTVNISKYNEIGEGTIICAGCIVTVNIKIGKHVILNIQSTVGHDATIGDFTTLLPNCNISGNVHIGKGCNLGTNTIIIPGANLGECVTTGAGAVVVKSIEEHSTAVGIPAKVIKTRSIDIKSVV